MSHVVALLLFGLQNHRYLSETDKIILKDRKIIKNKTHIKNEKSVTNDPKIPPDI